MERSIPRCSRGAKITPWWHQMNKPLTKSQNQMLLGKFPECFIHTLPRKGRFFHGFALSNKYNPSCEEETVTVVA